MRLLSGPMSLFGAKAEIALREKRLPAEVEHVPFGLTHRYAPKHPEVLRANPKRQVPVLLDGSLEIYDSTQIFEYLEDAYPDPALWPSEPRARAIARQIEHESDEVLFPQVARLMAAPEGDDPARLEARRAIAAHCQRLEDRLPSERGFLMGEFGYPDIAVFMTLFFAEALGAPLSDTVPRLHIWRAQVLARPAVAGVASAMASYMERKGLPPLAFMSAVRTSAPSPHLAAPSA